MAMFAIKTSINGGEYSGGFTVWKASSVEQIDRRTIRINGRVMVRSDDPIETVERKGRGGFVIIPPPEGMDQDA